MLHRWKISQDLERTLLVCAQQHVTEGNNDAISCISADFAHPSTSHTHAHTHTHTHAQPFYGSLDFVRDNPGEPVPKETFTHSHLS